MTIHTKLIIGIVCAVLLGLIMFQIPFGRSVESIILEKLEIKDADTVPRTSSGLIDLVAIYNARALDDVPLEDNMIVEIWEATRLTYDDLPPFESRKKQMGNPIIHTARLGSLRDYLHCYDKILDESPQRSHDEIWDYLDAKEVRAHKPWTRATLPEVGGYLDDVNDHLERIEAVVDKQLRVPMEALDMNDGTAATWIMNFMCFRDVQDAFLVRAMNRLGENRVDDCLHDIRTIRTIGKKLSQEREKTLIIFGILFHRVATLGDIEVLKSQALSADRCRTYREELQRQKSGRTVGWNLDELDYDLLNVLQQLAAGKTMNYLAGDSAISTRVPFPVNWQSTLEILFAYRDRMTECYAINDCRQRFEKARELDREIAELAKGSEKYYWLRMLAGANSRGMWYGERIAADQIKNWAGLVKAEIREASKIDLVIVGLAIEEFRIDTGKLPTELNELVPGYLAEIPSDSCHSEPLEFLATTNGYFLYSFGTDSVDDLSELLNRDVSPDKMKLKRWQSDDKDFGIYIEYARPKQAD